MIDFRYHLVSIVAVFLALGLGLILGATALKPYVTRTLKDQSHSELAKISKQQLLITGYQDLVAAGESAMLDELLAGERVVVVEAPGADSGVVQGVMSAIRTAGGSVTGQVQLQPQLFDTSATGQSQLRQLTQHLGAIIGKTPSPGSAIAQAGQALAGALLTKDGPGQPPVGVLTSTATRVVDGFVNAGDVALPAQVPAYADLAVMVAPATATSSNDADPVNRALVTVSEQFERAGQGIVVAGSSGASGPGSMIDALRADALAKGPSSVDDADISAGDIAVVWALCKELRGIHGNYGFAATANNSVSPAPTPSPTPTVSSTASSPPSNDPHRPTHSSTRASQG